MFPVSHPLDARQAWSINADYTQMVLDPTKHPLFILLVVEVFLRSALALKVCLGQIFLLC